MLQHERTSKNLTLGDRIQTQRDNTLYGGIYMVCPEKANLWRQKLINDCVGLGNKQVLGRKELWVVKMSHNQIVVVVARLSKFTRKHWIFWCINQISIKLL